MALRFWKTAHSAPSGEDGARTATVRIGDRTYRMTGDDDYLGHVASGSGFEPAICRLFASLIGGDDHVVDVGANIGCTALLFGELAREVDAFEPSPSTFAFLERNVRRAGAGNIRLHNVALGREAARMGLTYAPSNRSGGFLSATTRAGGDHIVEEVEVVVGDDYFRARDIAGVDFVKLDVEGFELEVLSGLRGTIEAARPVCVVEMNHWCLNAFQRVSVPDFIDALLALFPFVFAYDSGSGTRADLSDEGARYHVMYRHIVGGFAFSDIVCAYAEKRLERFRATFPAPVG